MAKYQRPTICAKALALMLVSTIAFAASHNPANDMESLELRPGVIVDLKENRIYLMSPKQTVEAVDINAGQTLWRTDDAAKPLAVGGGLLVCQADASATRNNLNLVILNAQNGRSVSKHSVALPSQVSTQIDDALSSRFSTRAVTVGDDSFVSWEHQTFPVRGAPPLPDESGQVRAAEQPQQISGTVKLDIRTGDASMLEPAAVPRAVRDAWPKILTSTPGAPPDPTQRISIDGNHTLKSKRIGDDSVWDKYQWTIIDNETEDEIGQLRSYLSQSGFVVVDSRIIFETGPYMRNTESGLVEEPLMVRMVDLRSGDQVWSRPVRDTVYRGPFPP
jgi:hypothetical protein